MSRRRWTTTVVALAASLAVSAVLYYYFHTVFVFFFLPVVPFLFRGRGRGESPAVRRCPTCGFETVSTEYAYCPRDGTELE